MPKVILICGKICSGKTTYAKQICRERMAVLLSSDELISSVFHPNENEYHDLIIEKVHTYLLNKSIEIIRSGTDVVLDWGFWTHSFRETVSTFYHKEEIETEWHYVDIVKANWERNIQSRNDDVRNNRTTDYFVDEGLLSKLERLFVPPSADEMDVWVNL